MSDHAVECYESGDLLSTRKQCQKLYGRADELQSLRSLIHESQNGVQIAFVDGASGSGKSALIQEAYPSSRRIIARDASPLLLVGYGKFKVLESRGNGKPFAALIQSLANFAAHLETPLDDDNPGEAAADKTSPQELLAKTRQAVQDQLKDPSDQDILVEFCSDLEQLFPERSTSEHQADNKLSSNSSPKDPLLSMCKSSLTSNHTCDLSSEFMAPAEENSSHHNNNCCSNLEGPSTTGLIELKNVLRLFFRALVSAAAGGVTVVWILDDLQWMDDSSLSLLVSVLEDPQLKQNLVFAGAYRTQELAKNKAVCDWVQGFSITSRRNLSRVNTTRISVGALAEQHVQELLSDVLLITPSSQCHNAPTTSPSRRRRQPRRQRRSSWHEPGDVSRLSRLVHSRTDGKVFFILQLLDYLQEQNMVGWYDNRFWFDVDDIQRHLDELAEQAYLDNMSDDRSSSISSTSTDMDSSILGPSFRTSTLCHDQNGALGIHIVMTRLHHLPAHTQHGLRVAACLGSLFDPRMLQVALQGLDKSSEQSNTTTLSCSGSASYSSSASSLEFLQSALQLQFVEEASSEPLLYKFRHDKLFEASLRMKHGCKNETEEAERLSLLRWKIGRAIWDHWLEDAVAGGRQQSIKGIEDRIIFVCTDLLDKSRKWVDATVSDEDQRSEMRMQIARLNFEAGQRSARMNAFVPAMAYLRTALELIEASSSSAWKTHYIFMTDLHTIMAEACLGCGQLDAIPPIVEAALAHKTENNPLAVFRIQYVTLQRLVMTNQISQLLDESLALLSQLLGETFSKTPTEALVNRRCKQLMTRLAKVTDQDILELPKFIRDKRKLAAVKIIANILAQVQYFSKFQGMTKLLQFRCLEITLDHGLSKHAPNCFAFCAFALFDETSKAKFDASIRVTNLALMLAKQRGGKDWHKEIAPDSLIFRHWTRPYAADVDDAFAMYQRDLKRGHLVTAFQGVAVYLYLYYYSGLALGPLVDDAKTICEIKMEYGQHLRLLHMLPLFQLILNLTGQSDDILDMYNGEAMNYRRILGWGKTSRDGEEAQWAYSLQLYVYCENWQLANEMYDKMIDKEPGFLRSSPLWHNRVFFFALIGIQNAKRASWLKGKKQKREVGKHVGLMRMWVTKRNNINLVHKLQLLEAEMLTLQRVYPSDAVLVYAYDKAIQNAMRSGYVQDAALAASFAARAVRDPIKQEDYALLAQNSYKKWGAMGLVTYLQETSDLHERAAQRAQFLQAHFGLKSRQRFDRDITRGHQRLALAT